ncbi:MAG: hypothetical protein GY745_19140 [Actinomycetia bacterium]|nr:hypothetical protein [Actinomycetes bacterium]MCP4087137.1 hypothetical protein [Actinomycetes bacterium]
MAAGWRQMYNQWEEAVSPSLEQFAGSDVFRDMVGVGAQISKAVMKQTEEASRQWLHLWNLPAAGDVRSLRRQIAGLDREVQSLRRALDDAGRSTPNLTMVQGADEIREAR